jgi:hypothetical protein
MLKAKFALTAKETQEYINRSDLTGTFLVEPTTYDEKRCNVVSDNLSIMALIGFMAGENQAALLDVTRL